MTGEVTNIVVGVLPQFEGYVYPNEASFHPVWSTLIVIYPYITGLVAGAFIMASLPPTFRPLHPRRGSRREQPQTNPAELDLLR